MRLWTYAHETLMHLLSWESKCIFFIFNSMQEEDINKVSVTLFELGI